MCGLKSWFFLLVKILSFSSSARFFFFPLYDSLFGIGSKECAIFCFKLKHNNYGIDDLSPVKKISRRNF